MEAIADGIRRILNDRLGRRGGGADAVLNLGASRPRALHCVSAYRRSCLNIQGHERYLVSDREQGDSFRDEPYGMYSSLDAR